MVELVTSALAIEVAGAADAADVVRAVVVVVFHAEGGGGFKSFHHSSEKQKETLEMDVEEGRGRGLLLFQPHCFAQQFLLRKILRILQL